MNEEMCYVEEKLISPDGSAGLSLPLLCLLFSIKTLDCLLLCMRQAVCKFACTHTLQHTLKHSRQDVEKQGCLNKTLFDFCSREEVSKDSLHVHRFESMNTS